MNKIRLITAIALIGVMLTGCANNNTTEETTTSTAETTAHTAAEETTTQTTVTTAVTKPPKEEPFSLENSNSEERKIIIEKLLEMEDDKGNRIFNSNAPETLFTVISPDEFSVDTTFVILPDVTADKAFEQDMYRKPTTLLSTDSYEYDSFYSAVDSAEKSKYSHTFSNYDITESNAVIKIKVDENLNPEIVSITQSYTIDNVKVNAFVSEGINVHKVIIDPAYMHEIPVPVYVDDYEYNINGHKLLMDTIQFSTEQLDGDFSSSANYAYAEIEIDGLTVSYNSEGKNYSSAKSVNSVEVLYNDGAEAIDSAELLKKFDEKNDDSAVTYKTLTDNLDIFMGDDVVGVNLIDLDFNGTPELLVSRRVIEKRTYDFGDGPVEREETFADVDIYIIDSGKLDYIDTLHNNHRIVTNANTLGLKTLDNLDKKWYYMARSTDEAENASYLLELKDGKLVYEEIFKAVPNGKKNEYGEELLDYYFNGEKLEFTTYEGPHPYEGDSWTYYEWNGINATFGEWELWGFIREDYCKDIDVVYDLYTDRLVTDSYDNVKIKVNERTMEYLLAYEVDAFYYGYYNPKAQGDEYIFLDGYAKPVIYLYPEEETEVSVKVELEGGELTCTYPDYRDGWNVTAYPDGTIVDNADGNEYYCLYWEGVGKSDWDMSKGFVVKREDTAAFLREKLAEMGLTPRESNEFIIYWLPELQKNECNLITFQTEQYEKNAALDIDPVPDSLLRIFMVYEECDPGTVIEPQEFESFERNGFTVVEWGGSHAE